MSTYFGPNLATTHITGHNLLLTHLANVYKAMYGARFVMQCTTITLVTLAFISPYINTLTYLLTYL